MVRMWAATLLRYLYGAVSRVLPIGGSIDERQPFVVQVEVSSSVPDNDSLLLR